METKTTEVAPDIFRICTMISEVNLQFCQFLVRDEEPVLFHTGMRSLFPLVRDAVSQLVDPSDIRWVSFSHFEADECGALNEWLEIAPRATPLCGLVGAMVSVNDFSQRPARVLDQNERLETGKYRFQYCATPQVPHAWDAGLLFEETNGTLFCSDLLHQVGDVEPVTESDVVGRFRDAIQEYNATPFADYLPYTPHTGPILEGLAALEPKTLLPMHGSAYIGDGGQAIRDMAHMLKETLGGPA
jgi:flavorubredoxin